MTTILTNTPNTYNTNYDVLTSLNNIGDLNNKLFCTFTDLDNLDTLLDKIKSKYTIVYNKMFVLEIVGKDEYVITYNVDQGNVHTIPDNTILVHRKKESNTLYTINALNELIKKLSNEGVSEDAISSGENEIQKITDSKINKVDEVIKSKEVEITTI